MTESTTDMLDGLAIGESLRVTVAARDAASGTLTLATEVSGESAPYASTFIGSSSEGEARPVRRPLNSCWRAVIAPSMRFL